MEERNSITPVAHGEKKTPTIADEIHEAARETARSAVKDILFPSIRDVIGRMLHSMIDGLLDYDRPHGNSGRYYSNQTRYNYARTNERRRNEGQPSYRNGGNTSKYSYNNNGNSYDNNPSPSSWDSAYVFRSYVEADGFKTSLEEIIERYPRHAASIVDANDAAGITGANNKVDVNWGWKSLCGTPPIRTLYGYFSDGANGYEVALPRPEWIGND